MRKLLSTISLAASCVLAVQNAGAAEVLRLPMEVSGGQVSDVIGGGKFDVNGVHSPESVPGARGMAMRLDGYSTYIDAPLGTVLPAGSKKMTASVWMAVETYPIVEIDVNTTEQVAIASCLDETAKSGFGFFIGFDGKYSFRTYVSGWPIELKVSDPMPRYEWINLTAVVDTEARLATLYNNGVAVASSRVNGGVAVANSTLRIGRSFSERFSGPFCLTSFNGVIDDIAVWDEAISQATIQSWQPENPVDMSVPYERFADDPLRPAFHGMPGANWTNETHGMTYSNGRFHLFFQKNANGPFLSRLHWGHISSANLYDWREEPIAIAPGESYDIKGCWSGCVFSDEEVTGGRPMAIYTAVDYARAVIAGASPLDDDLARWRKSGIIINGRPSGLSDDFRDPYFFRTDNGAYIIVGSSKGGVGTTTLHAYDPKTGMWSNDGRTFFSGTNAATSGTFWEMPNVTRIGDKWIFTATPLNTSRGVASLYWTGQINADGTFAPDRTAPSSIELSGFARDGYGLLSPTIYQHEGKTIALGIVPDKLMSQYNHDMGYAHTYSLPREWTLSADGQLCQKPYSGLAAMRTGSGFSKAGFTLDGNIEMTGVGGRAVELLGDFTVGSGKCGFTLLDDGASSIKVYYDAPAGEIVVDVRGLDRMINDSGVFDGQYRSSLPSRMAAGETLRLNVFFDHSILDIFVNDTWASSVRVFADAKATENVTVFADSPVQASVRGWMLDAGKGTSGVADIFSDGTSEDIELYADGGVLHYAGLLSPAMLSVCDMSGRVVMRRIVDGCSGEIDTCLNGCHVVNVCTSASSLSKKIYF